MNAHASLHIMKTNYDTKVEYIEDNQNVSLPCIQLVMTLVMECFLHSSVMVAMATVLSTMFLFDLYAFIIISIVARSTM